MTLETSGLTPFAFLERAARHWLSSRMSLGFSQQTVRCAPVTGIPPAVPRSATDARTAQSAASESPSGASSEITTSELFSETWPKRGSMRSGACWEQTTSVPRIDASGCGYWRTPRAIYGEHPGMMCETHLTGQAIAATYPTPKGSPSGPDFARMNRPNSGGDDLATAIARGGATRQTWGTPTSRDHKDTGENTNHQRNADRSLLGAQVMVYRTPQASDGEKGGPNQTDGGPSLANQAAHMPTPTANRRSGLQSHGVNVISGSLNPTWVEWLMGWPRGWTDCEHLVTAKCLRRWLSRSRSWLDRLVCDE